MFTDRNTKKMTDFNQELEKFKTFLIRCFFEIEAASGQDKLFFIGSTGSGKSTLLNYLYGARYQILHSKAGKPYTKCLDGIEIAAVGQTMSSKTLYPLIMKQSGLNYVYCDLAGLIDNRGSFERICATSSIQILSRLPGNVKGILVVLDLNGFHSTRGSAFKETAIALAHMLQFNSALLDSVHFVITKAPGNLRIKPEHIVEEYIQELLMELKENSNGTDEDNALIFMLNAMQERQHQIHIPNISDHGASRKDLIKVLNGLKPMKAELYNFIAHDSSQRQFNQMILDIIDNYLATTEKLNDELPTMKADVLRRKTECHTKLSSLQLHQIHLENVILQLLAQIQQVNQQIASIGNSSPEVLTLSQQVADSSIKVAELKQELETSQKEEKTLNMQCEAFTMASYKIDKDSYDLKLQHHANRDLYVSAYKVSRILDMQSNPNLIKFWQKFSEENDPLCAKATNLNLRLFPEAATAKNRTFSVRHPGCNLQAITKSLGY